jgi:hypothetical protein
MPVTTVVKKPEDRAKKPEQIYVTRHGPLDRRALRAELAERARRGQITTRDEKIMEYLRELHVMSLDQVWRLFWAHRDRRRPVYRRLYRLVQYQLLARARTPPGRDMQAWGLEPDLIFSLGLGGWLWLKEEVNSRLVERSLKREQILHDLLTAEICTRLTEAAHRRGVGWQVTWAGDEAARYFEPTARSDGKTGAQLLSPDGLAILRRTDESGISTLSLFVEMDRGREAHGRPSSDWGRKVRRYDQFRAGEWQLHPQLANVPVFPPVLVITHGAQRMLNLAQAIVDHRQEPVSYYLTTWQALMAAPDILTAPVWLMLTRDGTVLGQEPAARMALLPTPGGREGDQ